MVHCGYQDFGLESLNGCNHGNQRTFITRVQGHLSVLTVINSPVAAIAESRRGQEMIGLMRGYRELR